jgi:hypothetical protein
MGLPNCEYTVVPTPNKVTVVEHDIVVALNIPACSLQANFDSLSLL